MLILFARSNLTIHTLFPNACLLLRHRWVDNIKIDLREIGWDCMDWIDMTYDREQWRALVNTVMNLWVP
jgi:hypothetical protein